MTKSTHKRVAKIGTMPSCQILISGVDRDLNPGDWVGWRYLGDGERWHWGVVTFASSRGSLVFFDDEGEMSPRGIWKARLEPLGS